MAQTLESLRIKFQEPRLELWKPCKKIERRASGIRGLLGQREITYEQISDWNPIHIEPPAAVIVSGTEAIATWRKLRAGADGSGYWPIVCGDDDEATLLLENLSDSQFAPDSPDTVVRQAAQTSATEFFVRRKAHYEANPPFEGSIRGAWPSQASVQGFFLPFNTMGMRPKKRVTVALIPAKTSSEVFAALSYGGWNDCPHPHEHIAIHRYWAERWGAEIVCVSGDIIEMQSGRRPANREEALGLAEEQYLYCTDLVTQGTETLENLAATLMAQDNWYFWWD